ncbi:hypothetical protein BH18ACT3_BH18ACT3_09850 [soil metagenome]
MLRSLAFARSLSGSSLALPSPGYVARPVVRGPKRYALAYVEGDLS